MTAEDDTFRRYARTYLTAGEVDLPALKASIEKNADKTWPGEFQTALRLFLDAQGKTQDDYTVLTNHEFDEPEEYTD